MLSRPCRRSLWIVWHKWRNLGWTLFNQCQIFLFQMFFSFRKHRNYICFKFMDYYKHVFICQNLHIDDIEWNYGSNFGNIVKYKGHSNNGLNRSVCQNIYQLFLNCRSYWNILARYTSRINYSSRCGWQSCLIDDVFHGLFSHRHLEINSHLIF